MSQHKDSDRLTQDEVFDLLSSPRRRYVIYYLQQSDGPVELGRLADEVASWENEISVDELTSQQRKRVYVSLYQTHIPRLEEFGIIDYDIDEGTVTVNDHLDDVSTFLSGDSEQRRWGLYYLVLAAASLVIYAMIALDIVALSATGGMVVFGTIITSFSVVALVHWTRLRRRGGDSLGKLVDRGE